MITGLPYNHLMVMVTQYNTTLPIDLIHFTINFFSINTYGATLMAAERLPARVVRTLVLKGQEIFFVVHRPAQLLPVAQTHVLMSPSIAAEYK